MKTYNSAESEMKYIGFWKRLLAYTIDMVPILLFVFGITYFFLGFDEILSVYLNNPDDLESKIQFYANRNFIRDTSLFLWVFYGLIMDCSRFQGTHGKLLLGIKVTNLEGGKVKFSKSLFRMIMKIIGAVPLSLGYIWAAFHKEKAAWHDLAAKTRVCQRNQPLERVGLSETKETLHSKREDLNYNSTLGFKIYSLTFYFLTNRHFGERYNQMLCMRG